MPKYTFNFDFSVDAWIQGLSIEADSIEEAKEKLLKYSLEEVLEEGYVKDCSFKDIDYTAEENEDPWEGFNDEEEEEEDNA